MFARTLILLTAMLLPGHAAAQVNALPSLPHLLVKGEAKRDVVPDRFVVSVVLTALDMRPDGAREKVQANLATLLTSLKQGGAIADSIDATVFSVAPEFIYEEQRRIFKGTRVTRQLRVTFPDADKTRAFLAQLQAGEEVQLAGINASYSDEAVLRAELKGDAMRQTRETADLLAKSYGARIGGLYSVSDVAPSFAYGIQAGRWPQAARSRGDGAPVVFDAPAPMDAISVTGSRITPESIEVGTIEIAEHLYAIFLLAD